MFIIINHKDIVECMNIYSIRQANMYSPTTIIDISLDKSNLSLPSKIDSIYLSESKLLYTEFFNYKLTWLANKVSLEITDYRSPRIDNEYMVHFRERNFDKLFPD